MTHMALGVRKLRDFISTNASVLSGKFTFRKEHVNVYKGIHKIVSCYLFLWRVLKQWKMVFFKDYLFEKEREREREHECRGGQREREKQTPHWAGSTVPAQSRTPGSWPNWMQTLNRLSHPGAPGKCFWNQRKTISLTSPPFPAHHTHNNTYKTWSLL